MAFITPVSLQSHTLALPTVLIAPFTAHTHSGWGCSTLGVLGVLGG